MDHELAALHSAPIELASGSEPLPPHIDAAAANMMLKDADALEIVRWVHKQFPGTVALSSSFGADSAVMLHLVTRVIPEIPVILIDTGYLFPETYRFAEALRERLHLNLHVYGSTMSAARQEALHGRRWEMGEDGVREYLAINKVEPMQRALRELRSRAWIAGLRRSQTTFRSKLEPIVVHDGRVKVHPILNWSKDQVEAYLHGNDLPRHPLFAEGYRSIGDWHSTWPVSPDEDDRAGRVLGQKKECGLHLTQEENSSLSSSSL